MNIEELKNELNFYKENSIGICVYALLKTEPSKPIKLDIEIEALEKLKSLFLEHIQSEIINNSELSLIKLSSSDERGNVIYEYDI